MKLRGRIKIGTMCGLDFVYFRWPNLPKSRMQPNFDPNMVFNIEVDKNGQVSVWTDNFGGSVNGRPGNYGNGQIHLSKSS